MIRPTESELATKKWDETTLPPMDGRLALLQSLEPKDPRDTGPPVDRINRFASQEARQVLEHLLR